MQSTEFHFDEYRQFLLRTMPYAKPARGGSEVVCKCMYCPDIGDHYHMYISIPTVNGEPSKYNCFKCGSCGYVTYKKLMEWNIYDTDMGLSLANYYKNNVYNNPYYRFSLYSDIAILNNNFIADNEISKLKINYINKRLGLNLSLQDCIDNKICLNLNDLLSQNYITKYTRDPRVIQSLNDYFLGFISFDNSYVNLKRLAPEGRLHKSVDERYINYNIFGKEDNSKKFYLSPTNIDLCNPNPIKVHIAEGPFDALSIKYNLRKEFDHNIYTAIAGNAYKGVIRQIISYMKLMNLEIHLYPDSDVDDYVIQDFIEYVRPYHYVVYIHRNQIGKDMGESLDKIRETIERVGL